MSALCVCICVCVCVCVWRVWGFLGVAYPHRILDVRVGAETTNTLGRVSVVSLFRRRKSTLGEGLNSYLNFYWVIIFKGANC